MSKYAARLYQRNMDPSRRNLVAVVQAVDNKFVIKLLKDNEEVVYSQTLDRMPACWHLDKNQLVYMENFESRKISYVKVTQGELGITKEFTLPEGLNVAKNITATLDPMIEAHPCGDKAALRQLIDSSRSQHGEPEQFLISSLPNRVFVLAGQEVVWFKPDSFESPTTSLQRGDLRTIRGWRESHRVISIFCSE